MSLEKLSSSKVYGGELAKYKFKVSLPHHTHRAAFVTPRVGQVVCRSRRPRRELQLILACERVDRQGACARVSCGPHLHGG